MANREITALPPRSLPCTGEERGITDNGTTTYQADLRYWGLSNVAITYNADGSVHTITKAGRTTTFTWAGGQLQTCSDGVVLKIFGYDGQGQVNATTVQEV